MNDRNTLLLIGGLFVLLLVISALYYGELIEENSRGKLTPELVDSMTKEEIKVFLEEREKVSNGNLLSLGVIIFGIVGAIVGATIVGYVLPKKRGVDYEGLVYMVASPEREVIREILKAGGEVEQLTLRQKLGLNKVAMTRLIQRMERKGQIIVSREGKINYVSLNERTRRALGI